MAVPGAGRSSWRGWTLLVSAPERLLECTERLFVLGWGRPRGEGSTPSQGLGILLRPFPPSTASWEATGLGQALKHPHLHCVGCPGAHLPAYPSLRPAVPGPQLPRALAGEGRLGRSQRCSAAPSVPRRLKGSCVLVDFGEPLFPHRRRPPIPRGFAGGWCSLCIACTCI